MFVEIDSRCVENLSLSIAKSVTQIISMTFVNFVPPKAGSEHEFLFNKLASIKYSLSMLSPMPKNGEQE